MIYNEIMILGSLFSFLGGGPSSGLRDDEDSPRALFARADLRAVNRQRRQLVAQFGFEDTISDPTRREIGSFKDVRRGQKKGRRTLVGGTDDG